MRARPGAWAADVLASMLALLLLCLAASAQTAAPLHVGTSGDYPPFSIVAADGRRNGFDIDLATKIASGLGRPLEFVAFRWPDLADQAKAGAFDVVASGVTIRPERVLIGRFTRPYALSEAVVLVRQSDQDRFRNLADLEKNGARVIVNRGGYLEAVARATFKQARVETTDDNRALDEIVLAGKADALVTDSIEAQSLQPLVRIASLTRDRKALFVPLQIAGGGDAFALHASLDGWLQAQERELEPMRRQWFKGESKLDAEGAEVEAVAALLDQRTALAPWIIAAKRRAGLPLEDLEREKKVLTSAAARAHDAGLPEERATALFAVLIEASKDVQRATGPFESTVTLDTLRGVLGELDQRLVAELASLRRIASASPERAAEIRNRLQRDIEAFRWPGVGEARQGELLGATVALLR